ncbi:MAG: ATP-binding domain-containing protein [Proteobacteria bacterium]|nr:ATP-binding domain-containing protein [Pseudomonadota bacterium]
MKQLDPASAGHPIIDEEQGLLGRVLAAVAALGGETAGVVDFDGALIALRDQIAEAKLEDVAPLVEQMTRLSAVAQRYGKGRDLPIDPTSPYFAHLKLVEGPQTRDVLIGRRGFIDRRRGVQVVDWRHAPVSRIYYRYAEGDDFEERFGERISEGVVAARRNLTIEGGRLRRIGSPHATYVCDGAGHWQEADPVAVTELQGGQGKAARPPAWRRGGPQSRLGLHGGARLRADKHLPEIAALIDPRQFELITQPESGLIVLQGGAGTGKTTVALHRVAYLNYQRPPHFRGDPILVIVPSRALAHYVEHVLPALDVRGVRVVTARAWFERLRRRLLPGTTSHYNDEPPATVTQLKKHPLLLTLLREYVDEQQAQMGTTLAAELGALDGAESLLERWHASADQPLIPRLAALRRWFAAQPAPSIALRQRAEGVLRRLGARANDVLSDWAEALTSRERLARHVALEHTSELGARHIDELCRWAERQDAELDASAGPESATDAVSDEEAFVAADGRRESLEGAERGLDPADDPLLAYLCWLKQGELRPVARPGQPPPREHALRCAHLVIDEAQDLSALELKVLLETTRPHFSVTLAGDTAQRVVFDNAFADWESLLARLGVTPTANTTLELGYRSTEEVMALARGLLGPTAVGPAPRATRRGAPVELHRFAEQGEAVAVLAEALRSLLLREPLASVALITRHPAQAALYAEDLQRAEVPSVRLVRQHAFSFRPGIEVTDVAQVKGLEFDYVVLLDVTASNYPATLESRHLLHIGATRAAHQLWLTSTGTPSALLPPTLIAPV